MNYDYDIETAIENIYSKETRRYFDEVYSSFTIGNYRSASVLLWSTVIYDLISKLSELQDYYDDPKAKSILTEIKEKEANPTSSEWESALVRFVHERTEFIDGVEKEHLLEIQRCRHVSAHPVIQRENSLYIPNKYEIKSNITKALKYVLTKPAILGKNIATHLVADLEEVKDLFPENDKLEKYLTSKYLSKLNSVSAIYIFNTLWKFVFKLNDVKCNENRDINLRSIHIIFNKFRAPIDKSIEVNDHNYEIHQNHSLICSKFLCLYPSIYRHLPEHTKQILEASAEDDINTYCCLYLITNNARTSFKKLFAQIIREQLTAKKLANLTLETILVLKERVSSEKDLKSFNYFLIRAYCESPNYEYSDTMFDIFIKPYLSSYTLSNFKLLFAESSCNSQIEGRSRNVISQYRLALNAANELGFDNKHFDNYSILTDNGLI